MRLWRKIPEPPLWTLFQFLLFSAYPDDLWLFTSIVAYDCLMLAV